jgi:hypothetical protein
LDYLCPEIAHLWRYFHKTCSLCERFALSLWEKPMFFQAYNWLLFVPKLQGCESIAKNGDFFDFSPLIFCFQQVLAVALFTGCSRRPYRRMLGDDTDYRLLRRDRLAATHTR